MCSSHIVSFGLAIIGFGVVVATAIIPDDIIFGWI
jgi:hypothetical protein